MSFYALIGDPVEASPSPAFQAASLRAIGSDAEYRAIRVTLEDLGGACKKLREAGVLGFNVTTPLKAAIRGVLQSISETARMVDAVNTVVVDGDNWHGENTDVDGFLDALETPPAGLKCVVVGAGGAARSVAFALLRSKAKLTVVARRSVELFGQRTTPFDSPEVSQVWSDAQIIVCALPRSVDPRWAQNLGRPDSCREFMDLNYGMGATTPLVSWARGHGILARDGSRMLLGQGSRSFQMWTGQPMATAEATQALCEALQAQEI